MVTADSAPADFAIEARALRKVYRTRRGRQVAVDDLDLLVPPTGVHGFLGPNGSGKTTTIRMLLGLIRSDGGSMRILGHQVPQHLPEAINSIGAIVEQPRFFPNFSGRLNLELTADVIGVPRDKVERVLDQVGLRDRASDAFRTYSLGMKQRLAVAGTLLKDPQVLIFDEPTNGLDPAGIHEIRETMRALGSEGRAVLVSSHILSEVEQVADTVTIIGRGKLLAHGTVADVMGHGSNTVRVVVSDPRRAAEVLTASRLTVRPSGTALLVDGAERPAVVSEVLAREGLFPDELFAVHRGLESVFLELTRGTGPEAHFDASEARQHPGSEGDL